MLLLLLRGEPITVHPECVVHAVGLVGAEAALFWGGSETVARYVESGWGDGLEVFVYVVPVTAGLVGLILLATLPTAESSADHGRRGGLGAAAPPAG